jgi:nitrogen-specific signal transduction histidine kinase
MELLALLSNDDIIITEVKEVLKRYTVYPLRTIEELEDLHTNIPLNLFLIDTVSHKLSRIEDLLDKLDDDMVILIPSEKPDKFTLENLPKSVYDCIDAQSIRMELPVVVERAIERQRFKNELSLLKKSIKTRDDSTTLQTPSYSKSAGEALSGRPDSFQSGKYLQEKVLVNFAKMLTVSFDMRKLFNHFMDSVMEIARVSKMSVMLRDKEGFYVKTHYGLDPYIADNLKLKKDSALATWLAKTGRIMHKPVNPADTASINIKSEMELLQCTFSFPMIHKGRLIGIFNIDNKITEEPFYREELEIIYVFCNYLAAAVKDIDLYHQIWYQKEFTKNILSSMNSGVIAIDKDEKISIFNQQASEILNLDSSEVVDSDLRSLPSPLGDILYETMMAGTSYKRYEVEIQPGETPIGINSYRLLDEQQNPIGAGIVFSDLSDSKKLEEERSRAEKLEAVNDFIAKMAHEVRTPLTSIQTYTQLLSEKYGDDKELQNFFTTTVIQSIHKLDSLIDKLVIFLSKPDYNFSKEDVNLIIDEAADYISKNIPQRYKFSKQGINESLFVNADRKLLIKAIYYLVLNIIDKTPDGTSITMSAQTIMRDSPSVEISIKYDGDKFTEEEKQKLLKPLLEMDNLGTELNVPISHKIIERHNGSLDIKNEDGSDTFIIRLPAMDIKKAAVPMERGHIDG